ncbi:MAG: 16S rRNA (cytosine(1402)-N(4))-methyltransferase RsmH [Chloroflexi bacterium]|nr:16S rRNA (cytosine(1402)-N(4))-methyltransferase RsmH [Chloroflexota bacterium]
MAEVLEGLAPRDGGRYVDGTVGNGGHAAAMLERSSPGGLLLGLDADPVAVEVARARLERFGPRAMVAHASYRRIDEVARALGFLPVDGVLLDLGISSRQLAESERGFSFRRDEALDMRFDPTQGQSAADLLNNLPETELANLVYRYGEEPRSRRIARAIVERRQHRPLRRTTDLVEAILLAVGGMRGRAHPATRTFQALRIAVNDELGALAEGLQRATDCLKPGGRLAVISFHSLEDRAVKWFIRGRAEGQQDEGAHAALRALTKRPIVPGPLEVSENPRARSAKLRVAERV